MRWRTVAAAVAVTGFLLAACGDDSGGDNGSGDSNGAENENGDASAENGDSGGDQNGEGENAASGSGGQFCEDLVAYVKEYNEVLTAAFEGSGSPEEISTGEFESLGEAVRSGAPAEIADDMEVTSNQMGLMVAGMTGDESANDELMADPDAFQTATDAVQDYAETTCGFDPDAYFDDNPVPIG